MKYGVLKLFFSTLLLMIGITTAYADPTTITSTITSTSTVTKGLTVTDKQAQTSHKKTHAKHQRTHNKKHVAKSKHPQHNSTAATEKTKLITTTTQPGQTASITKKTLTTKSQIHHQHHSMIQHKQTVTSTATMMKGLPTHLADEPVSSRHHNRNSGLTVTMKEGTLEENIMRIALDAGWSRVVWKVPFDYHWLGQENISGSDLQDVLAKILADYPLQAVFYDANHVVVITARNSQP